MSLAIYAAPFENNNNRNNYKLINNEDEDIINKKKTAKNKTQKKRNLNEEINPNVLSTIQEIHNSISVDEEENDMSNFVPPPKAVSAGSERIDIREEMNSEEMKEEEQYSTPYIKQYYNQYTPNKVVSGEIIDDRAYPSSLGANLPTMNNSSNSDVLEKMNYMIHLLEDQQQKKTEYVTEEIILYSFLGIFTIFVVDSFAKVGKYVR